MRRCKLGLIAHYQHVAPRVNSVKKLRETYKKHNKAERNRKTKMKRYHHLYALSKHGHDMNLKRKQAWRRMRREANLPVT